MSLLQLQISVEDTAQTLADRLRLSGNATDSAADLTNLARFIEGRAGGMGASTAVAVKVGGVQSSGTVTFSSFAAADTVTINGVVFTASASPSGANQFLVTGGDTLAAAALVVKINATNAPAKVLNVVTATSAGAVITVTSVLAGTMGNVLTLAISAHGSVSAANLAGGTDGTTYSIAKG
jgi:hypothetical protein